MASDSNADCAYCGLPLTIANNDVSAPRAPVYCCYGCRLADEISAGGDEAGRARGAMTRLGIAIFFAMNVMVFTTALWTQDWADPSGGNAGREAGLLYDLFRYISLILSVPVLLLLGGPLLENAIEGLANGRWTTDLLLVAGVVASYALSAWSVFSGQGHVYFEVGVVVLVCVTLGRWLEATGRVKTTAALDALVKLLPREVRRIEKGREQLVPLEGIAPGDLFLIPAGERIATDAFVIDSRGSIDEQLVTGESQPRVVEPGDAVYGGTLSLDGCLTLRATARAADGTLQRLVEAVRIAARAKGEYERMADAIARWFLPAVVLLALLAVAWHAWQKDCNSGILNGLAVVVIACPCALGIATPLAIWTALGRAATRQILIRNGDALAELSEVKVLCFDKTGTLTTGMPRVSRFLVDDELDPAAILNRAMRIASASTHPLAQAICLYTESSKHRSAAPLAGGEVIALAGRGLEQFDANGVRWCLGSLRFMEERGHRARGSLAKWLAAAVSAGEPLTCLGSDGVILALFVFEEQLRPEVSGVLDWARDVGLEVRVLTGDYTARAERLAALLGVAIEANLLPEEKQQRIADLRKRFGLVAMVGDGANDAPALAAADVGIAMGCGADVSRQTADLCLLGNELAALPSIFALARDTVATIRRNLFWTFAYNAAGIGLAFAGLLHPAIAAIAMVASSLLVVSSSLQLGIDGAADSVVAYRPDGQTPTHPSESLLEATTGSKSQTNQFALTP